MINWIKNKLGITKLESEILRLNGETESLTVNLRDAESKLNKSLKELKEYARIDADVGFRGNNTIILTGVMNGKVYIRFYDVGQGEFEMLAENLKSMKDHALIRHIDAGPANGMFAAELKRGLY